MLSRICCCFYALLMAGCVSASKYKDLELTNIKLEQDLKLYKEVESGELVEKFKQCNVSLNSCHSNRLAASNAKRYLEKKGWKEVRVEKKIRIQENELDYRGKEYVLISGVGLLGKPILYEPGYLANLFSVSVGPALAKDSLWGIELIDDSGEAIELKAKY